MCTCVRCACVHVLYHCYLGDRFELCVAIGRLVKVHRFFLTVRLVRSKSSVFSLLGVNGTLQVAVDKQLAYAQLTGDGFLQTRKSRPFALDTELDEELSMSTSMAIFVLYTFLQMVYSMTDANTAMPYFSKRNVRVLINFDSVVREAHYSICRVCLRLLSSSQNCSLAFRQTRFRFLGIHSL